MTVLDEDQGLDFDIVSRTKADADANAANAGAWTRRYNLADGEDDRIRIIGGKGQPHRSARHWLQRIGRYETCAVGVPNALPCLPCFYQLESKAISTAQPCISWSVISDAMMHLLPQRGTDGKDFKKHVRCANQPWLDTPVPCALCTSQVERKRSGRLYWDVAVKHAVSLTVEEEKLRRKCTCGLGVLKTASFECSNCGDPVPPPPPAAAQAVVTCTECTAVGPPKPVRKCTNPVCVAAKQRSILDCWIRVRRIGAGTDTTYAFDPELRSDLSAEDAAIKAVDFSQLRDKRPTDPRTLAAALGIELPAASVWVVGTGGQAPGTSNTFDDGIPF